MEQISNDRGGFRLLSVILDEKHDIHVGGKTEFFPPIAAESNDSNELSVGMME
jgi:hypothetical protein